MRKNMKIFFGAICMAIWTCFPALPGFGGEASKIETIHVVTPSWPDQTNEDGTGLFFDIVRGVYEPEGIKMTYEILPWKRAEVMIDRDRADAMVDVLRNNAVLTPKHPMNVLPQYAAFKRERIGKWEGVKSLDGMRVIWFRGYDYHKNPHLSGVAPKWEEVDDYASAWRMLKTDRADFYLDAFADMDKYVGNNHVDMNVYRMEPVWNEKTYMSFSKSEKSEQLIRIYDKRIVELFDSGELEKIFEKWNYRFVPEAWKE